MRTVPEFGLVNFRAMLRNYLRRFDDKATQLRAAGGPGFDLSRDEYLARGKLSYLCILAEESVRLARASGRISGNATDASNYEAPEPTSADVKECVDRLGASGRRQRRGRRDRVSATNACATTKEPVETFSVVGIDCAVRRTIRRMVLEVLPSLSGRRIEYRNLARELVLASGDEKVDSTIERVASLYHGDCDDYPCYYEEFSRYLGDLARRNSGIGSRVDDTPRDVQSSTDEYYDTTFGPERSDSLDNISSVPHPSLEGGAGSSATSPDGQVCIEGTDGGMLHEPSPQHVAVDPQRSCSVDSRGRRDVGLDGATTTAPPHLRPCMGHGPDARRDSLSKPAANPVECDVGRIRVDASRIPVLMGPRYRRNTPRIGIVALGAQVRGVQPTHRGPREGWQQHQNRDARRRAAKRLRPRQEAHVGVSVAKSNLAGGNSSRLPTQRGARAAQQGADGRTKAQPKGIGAVGGHVSEPREKSGAVGTVGRGGGDNSTLPPETQAHVSASSRRTRRRADRRRRLANIRLRQEREIENSREGRGSQVDTSAQQKVQPGTGPVHSAHGTPAVQHGGPRPTVSGGGAAATCKGKKSPTAGTNTEANVGKRNNTRKSQSRSEQVGCPRKSRDVEGNAQVLPHTESRPPSPVAPGPAAQQSGLDQEQGLVQKPRRRHKWRYDDSAGQLCCSLCDNYRATPDVIRACRRQRKRFIRRERLTRAQLVQRFAHPGGRTPTLDMWVSASVPRPGKAVVEKPRVNKSAGRRGRPRVGRGETAGTAPGESTPALVDSSWPELKSGGSNRSVSSDRVLPAQTSTVVQRNMGNDTIPVQSPGNSNGSVGQLPAETRTVSTDGLGRAGPTTQRLPSNRAPVPAPRRSLLVKRASESQGTGTDIIRDRPSYADKSRTGTPALHRPGAKGDVRRSVGSNANGPTDLGSGGSSKTPVNRGKCPVPKDNKGAAGTPRLVEQLTPHVKILKGDALAFRPGTVLCHCVGQDLALGAGFAKALAGKYGKPMTKDPPLGCVIWQPVERLLSKPMWIAHMVVKPRSSELYSADKYIPNLEACLRVVMGDKVRGHTINMPNLIGCGLDRMKPSVVIQLIADLAQQGNTHVVVWDKGGRGYNAPTTH